MPVGFANELAAELADGERRLPASLRSIVVGGEAPRGSRLAELLRAGSEELVVTNAYGPTEAVIEATAHDLRTVAGCGDPVPMGAPLENTTVHLLDARLRPVPFGALGEVFIGGVALARGYVGRPAETAEVFLPDPFSRKPGARLYRTGDMARYRSDGHLVFAGRRDGQVKIRGFRVELEEIEAALLRVPGIRDAAVLVSGKEAHARVLAFVVAGGAAELDPEVVRESVRTKLPEYMVPSRVVALDAMPRTVTGKVDRSALLALGEGGHRRGVIAPRDDLETTLARLWRETLLTYVEDVHESFFEAGGNSLLPLRLAAAVRRELGHDHALAEIFRRPTIAELARALRAETTVETTLEGAARQAGAARPRRLLGAEDRGAVAGDAGASSDLVPLRAGGGLAPLVCIHEIGGGVAAFAPLASHLDARRPVLGIQALDADAREGLERTAARHAETIALAVPEGPVHLLGWSYGAWLAFEIASRLRRRGRQTGALLLLDAAAPPADPPAGTGGACGPPPSPAARSKEDGNGSTPRAEVAALARAAATLWGIEIDETDPRRAIAGLRAAGALAGEVPEWEARAWLRGVAARLEAAERYQPVSYDGDVVVVRGTESIVSRGSDEALGWGRLVRGRLTVAWAPGSHYSIVEGEGARTIAAIVERHAAAPSAALTSTTSARAPGGETSAPGPRAEGMEGTR